MSIITELNEITTKLEALAEHFEQDCEKDFNYPNKLVGLDYTTRFSLKLEAFYSTAHHMVHLILLGEDDFEAYQTEAKWSDECTDGFPKSRLWAPMHAIAKRWVDTLGVGLKDGEAEGGFANLALKAHLKVLRKRPGTEMVELEKSERHAKVVERRHIEKGILPANVWQQ